MAEQEMNVAERTKELADIKFKRGMNLSRMLQKLTIMDVANKLGVSAGYYASIEHGKAPIAFNTKERIADALNMDVATLTVFADLVDALVNSCLKEEV